MARIEPRRWRDLIRENRKRGGGVRRRPICKICRHKFWGIGLFCKAHSNRDPKIKEAFYAANHDWRLHARMMTRIRFGTSTPSRWELCYYNIAEVLKKCREGMFAPSSFFRGVKWEPAPERKRELAMEAAHEIIDELPSVKFQWKHYFASLNLRRKK